MVEEYRQYAIPNNLPPNTPIDRMTRDRLPMATDPELDIHEIIVENQTTVRIYRRKNAHALPLFVYMHGGGFVTGSLETDDKTCPGIAKQVDVCVLSIEYRLAPEHPFPTGFEDCWEVLAWIISEDGEATVDVDLERGFLVGGTSAGANLTAGLAHQYKHCPPYPKCPQITGLVFWAGSWCHPDVRPAHMRPDILSVDEIDDAPGLTRTSIEYFFQKYGASRDNVRYSPLLNDVESWQNVVRKAYFAICGWDPRRDEAILFAKMLTEQGLDMKDHIYAGLPHGFWTTCPNLPVSKDWEMNTIAAVKWMLKGQTSI
ncbi:alpha/beta-hydrolase [Setomelanomma holmii]|uniref:Alpha/beta-hydrolase n=1 Tax=Setomelanomma holmii TaxID=210430 RepID=A0A9P4HE79_9PLEO|nr:alpha/beta-hydrolase [Setomelanomma holmii]